MTTLHPRADSTAPLRRFERHLTQHEHRRGSRAVLGALALLIGVTVGTVAGTRVIGGPDAPVGVGVAVAGPLHEPAGPPFGGPVSTTPVPDLQFRALAPGEHLGDMTVTIAATGERITRTLLADSRTDTERLTQPIDVHDPSLSAGFMLDAAWALPGIREEYDPVTGDPVMSIVAVHRNTQVPGVDGTLTTMHNIDQIAAGDRIEIDLADGSRQVWTAAGDHEFLPADDSFGELAVSLQAQTPRLLLYACDSTEGVPDPSSGTYTPDLRRFVLFELSEAIDAPLSPSIERLR